MAIPVIDFSTLNGDKRGETMALLDEACQKWGFFLVKRIRFALIPPFNQLLVQLALLFNTLHVQIENHEIDKNLMEKVKELINIHYEENLKEGFYQSEIAKTLEKKQNTSDIDWESAFFIWHRPTSNIKKITNISQELWLVNSTWVTSNVEKCWQYIF